MVFLLPPLILTVIISLFSLPLAAGLVLLALGWLIFQKYPIHTLLVIPATITVGEIFRIVILGYTYEISLTEVSILTITAYFLLQRMLQKNFHFRLTSVGFLLVIFYLLQMASIFWVFDASRTLVSLRILTFHLLLFWVTVNLITDSTRLKKAAWGLPLASFFIALQLILTVVALGGLAGTVVDRQQIVTPAGPWVTLSAMIFLSAPFAYAAIITEKNKRKKNLLLITTLISLLAGFIALGKAEIAALLLGTVLFFTLTKKWQPKQVFLLAVVAAILFLTPLAAYTQAFWQRITETVQGDSLHFRLEEWRVGATSFLEQPFLGVGAGNLKVLFQMKHSCHCVTEANNVILHIAVEFGILGLILAAIFVRDIWMRLKSMRLEFPREEQLTATAFLVSALMIAIISMAEVTFVSLNFGTIFWYFMGLIVVATEPFNQPKI